MGITERGGRDDMSCLHQDTYELPEPWPTGESIEVCNCCGMSRAHWEQGESGWVQVDLVAAREEIHEGLEGLR